MIEKTCIVCQKIYYTNNLTQKTCGKDCRAVWASPDKQECACGCGRWFVSNTATAKRKYFSVKCGKKIGRQAYEARNPDRFKAKVTVSTKPSGKKTRPCLRCDSPFASSHIGERLCPECRASNMRFNQDEDAIFYSILVPAKSPNHRAAP